jgi:hypothetical protein
LVGSIYGRGSSIDAFYQVSVHLAKWFQRRRFKKSVNQKQELPVAAMFVNGSGQNVQSLERTNTVTVCFFAIDLLRKISKAM